MNGVSTATKAPPKSRARTSIGGVLLASYVVVILLATLWPTPLDQGYSAAIQKVLDVVHRNGVPEWFGYNKLEFTANVAMFVPLGFLAALLLPTRVWWLALLICPALSIAIEWTQATFLAARFATATDVMSNSIGAVIGILAAVILRSIVYERDQKIIARALWQNGIRT
ncbi:glycopeptide antibiotics resistance protein [Cryobacterium sp. MP_3.1]|uniref:VanZ family protein n=1 Tax=Cryobacterium sp. MP_3.1 TaxID=3071711 RepID=UPI002DFC929A|nr:glycopeptide antibiotics resistance protein [Cryobacterium sp. MP_3.1]